MGNTRIDVFTAVVLDDQTRFSFTELCHYSGADAATVRTLVEEGLLAPHGHAADDWDFPGTALARARAAQHLQHDLGVNLAGAALVLELLEERDRLRRQVRRLEDLALDR